MIAAESTYPAYKASDEPWVARLPDGWATAPVKRHYAIQLGKMLQSEPKAPSDLQVPYLKAQHVQWFAVRVSGVPSMWASPTEVEQYGIRSGDLLVCEGGEGGRCGVVLKPPDNCIVQNAVHRVRPLGGNRNEYLQWVMSAVAATGWFDAITSKATIAHFTREKFGALRVPVPSPEEQEGIALFLAEADRRVRRYTSGKLKSIALLTEQLQAVTHRGVTCGPVSGSSLEATGDPWFPRVPVGWQVLPLRRIIRRAVDGPHVSPAYVDEGIPFISARNVKIDRWNLQDAKYISEADYSEFSKRVQPEPGDVLYTKGGTTGVARAVDLDFPFQVWVHVAVLKLVPRKVNPRYLAYALNSPRCYEQAQVLTRGATNQDLGLSRMKTIVLPVPPLLEQAAIVRHLDHETADISRALQMARREIELLVEWRTRLISDVVMGRIDVRGASRALSDIEHSPDRFDGDLGPLDGDDAADEDFSLDEMMIEDRA